MTGNRALLSLYCGLVFLMMLAGLLLPSDDNPMLVILPDEAAPGAIFTLLAGTDGRLVGRIGARGYVVRSKGPDFAAKLYMNGAPLVINALAASGCTGIIKSYVFRKV